MFWASSPNSYRALIAIISLVIVGLLNGQTNSNKMLSNPQPEPSSILGKIQSSLNQKNLQNGERDTIKLINFAFSFLAIALEIVKLVAFGLAIYFIVRLQLEEGLPFDTFWRRNDGSSRDSENSNGSSGNRDNS